MKTKKLCPIKSNKTECSMRDCALYVELDREGTRYMGCCFVHMAELLNLICMEMRGSDEKHGARYPNPNIKAPPLEEVDMG